MDIRDAPRERWEGWEFLTNNRDCVLGIAGIKGISRESAGVGAQGRTDKLGLGEFGMEVGRIGLESWETWGWKLGEAGLEVGRTGAEKLGKLGWKLGELLLESGKNGAEKLGKLGLETGKNGAGRWK